MPRVAMDDETKLFKQFEQHIDSEWRDRVSALPAEELKVTVVEVAKNEAQNQEAKEQDEDLARLGEQYDFAAEPYKLATKTNALKIKFALRCLKNKGG
jgi:hypothetical protein